MPATPEIETLLIVSVLSSIIGAVPGGQGRLVVTQVGGHFDDSNFVCPDQPFLQAGKRYVLFLKVDKRDNPANTTGYPRYYVAGIWSGLAAIESSNVIAFAARSRRTRIIGSSTIKIRTACEPVHPAEQGTHKIQ